MSGGLTFERVDIKLDYGSTDVGGSPSTHQVLPTYCWKLETGRWTGRQGDPRTGLLADRNQKGAPLGMGWL